MSLKKVLTSSSLYTIGNVLQNGVVFLLLPIYTRYVSTKEYGAVSLIFAMGTVISLFFTLGLQNTVVRFTYDKPNDADYLNRLYGTLFTFIGMVSAAVFVVFVFLAKPIVQLFCDADFWLPYVYVMLVSVCTLPFYEILQRIMQAHYEATRYVVQQLLYFFLGSGISILLVVGLKTGGLGIIIGQAVASVFFCVYTWSYSIRRYKLGIDLPLLRECLSYSVPLLPNRIAGFLPRFMDKAFLINYSAAITGIYAAGYRLGNGLSFLTQGFHLALLPWFYGKMGDGAAARKEIKLVARRTMLLIACLGLMVSLFAEEAISLILGPAYHDAWKVLPIAAFVVVFNRLKIFWLMTLTYNKSGTRYAPAATYTFAILCFLFNIWLIPHYGMMGAAFAILLARFLSTFVMLYYSLKVENINYPIMEMYAIAIGAFIFSLVAYIELSWLIIVKILLALVAAFIVWVMARDELRLILRALRQKPLVADT